MKLFIATLGSETNTFAPLPTGLRSYQETLYLDGTATSKAPNLFTEALHVWRRRAEALGWKVVESLAAFAQPAGPTVQQVWEDMRDKVASDLRAMDGADIVLIQGHGAMVSDACDDCEGELMGLLRQIAPKAVIGLELDPHFHLTQAMMAACDLIISFKEYPHTDASARAEELFDLALATAEGRIRPVMRDFDCHMIGMYMTPQEPVRSFVDSLQAMEGLDGILSISLAHGFPWGDVADVGTRVLVIADGDADRAAVAAETIGRRFYDMRDRLAANYPDIETALGQALAETSGPVVLADMADNAGGGAPSDATFLLRAVLDRGITNVATGIYWDPVLTRICAEAGIGATLDIRLGGKLGVMSGNPLDLTVTVRGHRTGMSQVMGGGSMAMGEAVWLETRGEGGGVDIIVNDTRTQCFSPSAFEDLGIRLAERKIVCVKSTNHFYAGFAPIASRVIHVATPGAITPDYAAIPYTKRAADWWPLVPDPLGCDRADLLD